jgi:hypothetical protein
MQSLDASQLVWKACLMPQPQRGCNISIDRQVDWCDDERAEGSQRTRGYTIWRALTNRGAIRGTLYTLQVLAG